MSPYSKRSSIALLLLALLTGALFIAHLIYAPVLPRIIHLYGWVLFALIVILSLYNARKKLPFLPLGTSEGWMQFHIYAGLLTVVLFAFHVRLRLPTGWFDSILFALYLLVTLSGIIGLGVTRMVPKRLTTRGGEVLYELIPVIRRSLQEQAEALVLKAIPEEQSTTLADFYVRHLKDFFDHPRNFWPHLFEIRSPLNSLVNRINDLNRFLDEKERATASKVSELVRQKDGLDHQRALQITLKIWLFVHIPFTYSLLIFSILHIVIIYAFSGGAG